MRNATLRLASRLVPLEDRLHKVGPRPQKQRNYCLPKEAGTGSKKPGAPLPLQTSQAAWAPQHLQAPERMPGTRSAGRPG